MITTIIKTFFFGFKNDRKFTYHLYYANNCQVWFEAWRVFIFRTCFFSYRNRYNWYTPNYYAYASMADADWGWKKRSMDDRYSGNFAWKFAIFLVPKYAVASLLLKISVPVFLIFYHRCWYSHLPALRGNSWLTFRRVEVLGFFLTSWRGISDF